MKKIDENTCPCEKIQIVPPFFFKFWIWQCHWIKTRICNFSTFNVSRNTYSESEKNFYRFLTYCRILKHFLNCRYTRHLIELTVQLYRMLGRVDKEVTHLKFMDSICDILYHVKYQFTGDSVRQDAEKIVKDLRPALQLRLRFISPAINVPQTNMNNGK